MEKEKGFDGRAFQPIVTLANIYLCLQNKQGAHLRLQTLPSYSFVKKMTPTGNDGNYKMSGGVIPDIVDALQVWQNI